MVPIRKLETAWPPAEKMERPTVIIRHLVVGLLLESLVHFLLERGNLAGFSTSCVLVDNISLFQQSFSEHISSEHFAVTVILILLEADKLSLAWFDLNRVTDQ